MSEPHYNDEPTRQMWSIISQAESGLGAAVDSAQLRHAIEEEADVLSQDRFGRYALMPLLDLTAAMTPEDRKTVLERVIPKYASLINHQDSDSGFTFLHVAARAGNIDAISMLLQQHADPDIININNFPPLWEARNAETFYALLDGGADVTVGSNLHGSVLEAWLPARAHIIFKPELMEERAKQISDIYRKLFFEKKAFYPDALRSREIWQEHFPVLISDEKASYAATREMWRNLGPHFCFAVLEKGVDLRSTDLDGNNLLAHSGMYPHIAFTLIDRGISLADKNAAGETPLQHWTPVEHEVFTAYGQLQGRSADLLRIYDEHYYTLNKQQQEAWDKNFSSAATRRRGAAPDSAVKRYLEQQLPPRGSVGL